MLERQPHRLVSPARPQRRKTKNDFWLAAALATVAAIVAVDAEIAAAIVARRSRRNCPAAAVVTVVAIVAVDIESLCTSVPQEAGKQASAPAGGAEADGRAQAR